MSVAQSWQTILYVGAILLIVAMGICVAIDRIITWWQIRQAHASWLRDLDRDLAKLSSARAAKRDAALTLIQQSTKVVSFRRAAGRREAL